MLRQTPFYLSLRITLPFILGLLSVCLVLSLADRFAPRVAFAAGEICFATPDSGTTVYSSTDASAVRNALGAANANDVVKVAGYCAGAILEGSTTQVALITQTLTLRGGYTTTDWSGYDPTGNPTTLDAQGGGRVIYVAGVDATLEGLTLTNGSETVAHGGGLYATNALTLTEVTVFSNTAAQYGGGAYVGGVALVTDSTFLSNTATWDGGGAVFNDITVLSGGVFQQNVAGANRVGGGAYFNGNAPATITGTRFLSNTFSGFGVSNQCGNNGACGGGFYAEREATLNNLEVRGNLADLGGGLFAFGATTLTNSLLDGNTAYLQGAAIYLRGKTQILHTTIVSPTVSPIEAIYTRLTQVHITNTIIASHTVGLSGDDWAFSEDYNLFDFDTVSNPHGQVLGAHSLKGLTKFYDTTAYTLTALSQAINAGANLGVTTDYFGAARPQSTGSDIGYAESPYATPLCFATRDNGTTLYGSNDASAVREALAAANAGEEVKVAGYCAGAINESGSIQVALITQPLTLQGGYTVTQWSTQDVVNNPTTLDAQGGGRVLSIAAEVTLSGLTLTNGYITDESGAGLYATQPITLTQVTFYSNTAKGAIGAGGGAYFGDAAKIATSSFTENTAHANGGGAYFNGLADLSDTTFTSNNAASSFGGGALFANTAYLTNTTFISNNANGAGGARFNAQAFITGGGFSNNTSVAFSGGGASFLGATSMTGAAFIGNSSPGVFGDGGAVYLNANVVYDFTNVLFDRNAAARKGAALYANSADLIRLNHVTFVSPTLPISAQQAIYLGGTVNIVGITNTIVASHTIGIERVAGTVSENYNLYDTVTTPFSGTIATGANSITGTAAFYDTTSYTLMANSDAIDAGTDTGVTNDYFGNVRPQQGGPDLGYAESPYPSSFLACYATPNDGATVYGANTAQAVRDALAVAGAGSVVKVTGYCAGTLLEGGSTQVALIAQTLTLQGGYTTTDWFTQDLVNHPTTLDALSGGHVLSLTAEATVDGLTLTNGYATDEPGGGLYTLQPITLTNLTFYSNTVTGTTGSRLGGGAYFSNAANVTGVSFNANTTNGDGGGAYFNGIANVTDATFSSNIASSGAGGGARFQGVATVTNTTFSNNTALSAGGARFSSVGNVISGTFNNNTSLTGGGGGAVFFTTGSVTGTTFVGNKSTGSNGGGGAQFVSRAYMTNTTFISNTSSNGGGVAFLAAITEDLSNVLFASNRATTRGAAIYASNAGLRLFHATIVSPTVPTGAKQAIYLGAGTLILRNTIVASHTIGIERAGGTVTENYNLFDTVTTPYSGTITAGANSITGTAAFYDTTAYTLTANSHAIDVGTDTGVTSDYFGNARPQQLGYDMGYAEAPYPSSFLACYATPDDGTTVYGANTAQAVRDALAVAGAGSVVKVAGYCAGTLLEGGSTQVALIAQMLTLQGGYTITDWFTQDVVNYPTTLDALGGGRVLSLTAEVTVDGLTLTNGYVTDEPGGGLHTLQPITLTNLTFYSNTVTGTTGTRQGGGAYLGGVAMISGTAFLTNTAYAEGGGLYLGAGDSYLTNTTFIGNQSTNSEAGGLRILASGGVVADGLYFYNNRALGGGGGAVSWDAPNGQLFNSQVISNSAQGDGGGIYFNQTIQVSDTTFSNNTTSGLGGGAYFAGDASVLEVTFASNMATDRGGGARFSGQTFMTTTSFLSNTSSANGGGALIAGNAVVTDSTFTGNTATGDGGGALFVFNATVTNLTFTNNSAGARGGGVYVDVIIFQARTFVNVLLDRNRAGNHGAAIYISHGAPTSLIHSTIVSPTLPTGATQAVYVAGGTVYLTNTIVASHTVGIERASGTVTANYNLFDTVTTPYSGTITAGANSITGTAAFANPNNGDYHLSAGSAAINAGTNAGVTGDYEGDARPQGGGYDLGYDETSNAASLSVTSNSPKTLGQATYLTATLTNGNNFIYTWNFGDGLTATLQSLTISHTYALAGNYTVLITATNAVGSLIATTSVNVCNGIMVQNTNDSGAGSLRLAVACASAGDTITFASGLAGQTITLTSGEIATTNALTLDGSNASGVRVDGNQASRVFNTSAPITLTSLIVQNGSAGGDGGGLNAASTVFLSNTQFLSNTAAGGVGGGVYASRALTISGGLFQNNQSGNGGGVWANRTLVLTGTQFITNTGGNNGGGVFVQSNATFNGGLFQDNYASQGGGLKTSGSATLSGTQFLSNTALTFGGGASFDDTATLINVTFRGNTGIDPSAGGGGARFDYTANIFGVTFSNNTASQGGAAYIRSQASIVDTAFINNTARQGGGLYFDFANGSSQLTNVLLAGNTATTTQGAAIYYNTATTNTLSLVHTTIASATLVSGSALYVFTGTVYLTNTIVASHTAGIERVGGTVAENYNLYDTVTTPFSGTVSQGANSIFGTAAFYNTTAYTLASTSEAVDGGTNVSVTTDYFGASRPQGNYPDIGYAESPYSRTYVCYATPNDGGTVYRSVDAKAVRSALAAASAGSTVKIAGYCAGAISQSGTTQVALITKTLTLAGGYTTTNWTTQNLTANATTLDAQLSGRGVYASVAATLAGFTITRGTISGDGGGLYAASTLTLTDMTIYSNTATGIGGGAYVLNTTNVNTTTFARNVAGIAGGGVASGSSVTMTATNVTSNTAVSGGGAYFGGAATLTTTTFTGNLATSDGGGLRTQGALTIMASAFIKNTASDGGVVYRIGTSAVRVVNTLFAGNQASSQGMVFYLQGGGLVEIIHATITSPTVASGAAVYVNGPSVAITNTLIASHTIGLRRNSGTITENYNLFDTVTTPYIGGIVSGGNSLTGTAAFANPANGDYRLTPASDAVDVIAPFTNGCGTTYTDDYDGIARPQNLYCDIGAYELVNANAPVAVDDGYITVADTVLSVSASGVLSNDTDADNDALTASLINAPDNGTLTLNANGSFIYTPTVGYAGVDEFTYQATDGNLSDSATVSITVGSPTVPDIRFYGPGWNMFGWPLQASQAVTVGLASITGTYQTVYYYNAQVSDWEVYDHSLPPGLNDLDTLDFGRAYWITVTQDVTLTLSTLSLSSDAPNVPAASVPPPPTTYYGRLLGAPQVAPTLLTVYIGDTLCGTARVQESDGVWWYLVHVVSAAERAGCGQAGAELIFKASGQTVLTRAWSGQQVSALDLWRVPPQTVFLPLVIR